MVHHRARLTEPLERDVAFMFPDRHTYQSARDRRDETSRRLLCKMARPWLLTRTADWRIFPTLQPPAISMNQRCTVYNVIDTAILRSGQAGSKMARQSRSWFLERRCRTSNKAFATFSVSFLLSICLTVVRSESCRVSIKMIIVVLSFTLLKIKLIKASFLCISISRYD